MNKTWIGTATALMARAIAAPATAQCVKQSPAHAVALLELYTSEDLGLAAFVQDTARGEVLQATALANCAKG